MKVEKLIEMLKEFPPGYNVLVDGYEGDYDDVGALLSIKRQRNGNAEWYWGEWQSGKGKPNTVVITRKAK